MCRLAINLGLSALDTGTPILGTLAGDTLIHTITFCGCSVRRFATLSLTHLVGKSRLQHSGQNRTKLTDPPNIHNIIK